MAPKPNYEKHARALVLYSIGLEPLQIAKIIKMSLTGVKNIIFSHENEKHKARNRNLRQRSPQMYREAQAAYMVRHGMMRRGYNKTRLQKARAGISAEQRDQVANIVRAKRKMQRETGIPYEVHHFTPISKGGTDEPGNLWIMTREDHQALHAAERRKYKNF
jgi:hypothetical protein